MATKIQWTEKTWNPVVGCSMVSAGCKRCYALDMTRRLEAMGQAKYQGLTRTSPRGTSWTGVVRLHRPSLDLPLSWSTPRMVFVNSMSDLFHESLPHCEIGEVLKVMDMANQHTYQVLTKRSGRLAAFAPLLERMPHVWVGVSVEERRHLSRIDDLRKSRACVKFISLEPLLERLPNLPLEGIDWVIVGGESGPHARSCDVYWIRNIISQCYSASVPIFVKQLGRFPIGIHPMRHPKGGDPSEWPEDLRIREYPASASPQPATENTHVEHR